jgi:hypothetical protein
VLEAGTDTSFVSPLYNTPVTGTSLPIAVDLPLDTIHWRVRAASLDGLWSGLQSFVVQSADIPLLIPVVPDPTPDARPVLRWYAVDGARSYQIQVATVETFAPTILSSPLTDTSYTPPVDLPVGTVFWRVKSDLDSSYSMTDDFLRLSDTVPVPYAFGGDTLQTSRPAFRWMPVERAGSYRIEIRGARAGTHMIEKFLLVDTLSDTTYTPQKDLSPDTYVWRVSCDLDFRAYSLPDTLVIPAGIGVGERGRARGGQVYLGVPAGSRIVAWCNPSAVPGRLSLWDCRGCLLWRRVVPPGSSAATLGSARTGTVPAAKLYLVTLETAAGTLRRRFTLRR